MAFSTTSDKTGKIFHKFLPILEMDGQVYKKLFHNIREKHCNIHQAIYVNI